MDNIALADLCRRYKRGTERVVTWLATTSARCQITTSQLPAAHTAAKAKLDVPKMEKNKSTVQVSTSSLLRCASIIASSEEDIPSGITAIIKDVIEGREMCAQWYRNLISPQDPATLQQNSSHEHFINVLKDVMQVLQEARKERMESLEKSKTQRGRAARKTDKSDMTDRNLCNRFAALECETSSASLECEDFSQSTVSSETLSETARFRYELKDDEDTKRIFAPWCHLRELRDLRESVRRICEQHKTGGVSFGSAAMMIETAMSITKYQDSAFAAEHPDLTLFADIFARLGFGTATDMDEILVFPETEERTRKDTSLNFGGSSMELLCPQAWALMNAFASWAKRVVLGEEQQMTEQEKSAFRVHEFGSVLVDLLEDIRLLGDVSKTSSSFFDQFLLGMLEVIDSGGVLPTWTVANCQLFLDVYKYFEGDTAAPCQILPRIAAREKYALQQYLDRTGGALGCDCGATRHDTHWDPLQRMLEHDAMDPFCLTGSKYMISQSTQQHVTKRMQKLCRS